MRVCEGIEQSCTAGMLLEETKDSGQKQLKVAFAEGYLAADGTGDSKKTNGSRTMRWIRNFQQLLAIVVLIAVLASVMSEYWLCLMLPAYTFNVKYLYQKSRIKTRFKALLCNEYVQKFIGFGI